MPFYVVKLGGSLIGSARGLMRSLHDLTGEGYAFLVVPGGGPMADLVRDLFSKHGLSQEAAHWMAILAMEQYAYLLADGTGAVLTRVISRGEGLRVLLPYQALLEDDVGLEHSWEYTSDSIAALVALRLDAELIKATDVDGVILDGKVVEEMRAASLSGLQTCLDLGMLQLLRGRRCRVLNGSDPERFVMWLKTGTGGTLIKG